MPTKEKLENEKMGINSVEKKEKKDNIENKDNNVNNASNVSNASNEANIKNNKNIVKTVIKAVSTITEVIIWIMILFVLVLLLFAGISNKKDIGGYRIYLIMSGSMEPTIHVKQAIITKQIDEPKVGDIIAFGENEVITVHRIINVYTEGDVKQYKTKGDNNNTEDSGLVQKEHIKGVVKYRLPVLGEVILFLQSHLIVLILAIGILIIIILIRRLI